MWKRIWSICLKWPLILLLETIATTKSLRTTTWFQEKTPYVATVIYCTVNVWAMSCAKKRYEVKSETHCTCKNHEHLNTTSAGSTSPMIDVEHTGSTFCFQYHVCGVNIQANRVIKLMVVPMCCRSRLGDSGCVFLCTLEIGKNASSEYCCVISSHFTNLH